MLLLTFALFAKSIIIAPPTSPRNGIRIGIPIAFIYRCSRKKSDIPAARYRYRYRNRYRQLPTE
jgi:hypothetical protein